MKNTPARYKVLTLISVFIMTSYGLGSLVSGSPPVARLTPSNIIVSPGENIRFDASGSERANIYSWNFHDGSSTESGKSLSTITHSFGTEGIYHVTLFVNATNGKMDIATSMVTVRNLAPIVILNHDSTDVDEDEEILFDASESYDPDGSIASYEWDFGDGYTGYGEKVSHKYTKSGTYTVNLTVKDNLGKHSFKNTEIRVHNPSPEANAGGPYTINEGSPAYTDASESQDNPSDIEGLTYLWSNGYHGKRATEFYADDGTYHPSVTVTDDDYSSDSSTATVNVQNTPPKISVDGAIIKGNLTLRLAGERWHNVELWLYESGVLKGYLNVTRETGKPQEETISNISFDLSEKWEIHTRYTPDDDEVNGHKNGANPAWIILDFENGAYRKFHHTFNVRHPETYQWNLTLNPHFFVTPNDCTGESSHHENCTCEHHGNPPVHFSYRLYDAGMDDLTVNWSFADSYYEENFPASGFPNFVIAELNYTPETMGNITVNVTDDDGALTSFNINITNSLIQNLAPKVQAHPEVFGYEDSSVFFTVNASDSTGESNLSYEWYFGDGSDMNGDSVSHIYEFSALYPVLLVVRDSNGAEGFDITWANIENMEPSADFSYPAQIGEDSPAHFDASLSSDTQSDEPYLEYIWDFGDGSEGYGITAEHVYNAKGTYTVKLTVMDDDGAAAYLEKQITVNNMAPHTHAGPGMILYGPKMEITFTGTGTDTFSDRDSLSYSWDFGDGNIANGNIAKHTYTSSGTYTVYLTVTDDDGSSTTDSFIINVGIDSDKDSLTDETENIKHTNPNAWDSDSDYVADYWELYNYYTDPTKADSDGDGAPDWFEISYMGYDVDTDGDGLTNPWDWDSDGDLIADGKEIEINPTTEDITIITNPLVYNDFDEDKTEIRQNIERDALSVSDDNRVTVVVDYGATSSEKLQIQKVSDYEYQISSSISENLKAEIRMKLGDSMIREMQSDPYKYRMYRYDDSEGEWKILRHTDVDLDNGYIWGVTEHFSIFAIKNTATQDTDGDGLTDEYEMTHTFQIIEYPCESSPADEGWSESGHLDPWMLASGGYNSQHSWKAGGVSTHSYEMRTSIDLEMSPSNPLYLEFDYRYSQSSELSYFSVTTLLDIGYYYPSVSLQTDGNWHSVEPINLCPNRYPYYEITEDFDIIEELLRIHFYSHQSGDVLHLDNMRITRHLDRNNPDTDGDGLYDGWNDANGNGVWEANEEKGEIGDPNNGGAGGYGTSPINADTDGDGLSDGNEIRGMIKRYVVDKGIKGYLFCINQPQSYARIFTYHTNPLMEDTDMDGQPDSKDLIPLDYDMDGDGYINSAEIVNQNHYFYDWRITSAAENDPNLVRDADGNYIPDDDMDGDGRGAIFSEDFEAPLSGWSTTKTSSTSVIHRTTVKSHSGSYSMGVYQTNDDGDTVLYKTFSQQKTGVVTFWFYDDISVSGTQVVGIRDGSHKLWFGIHGDSNSRYVWRMDAEWYPTDCYRATGWHKISFVCTGEYTRLVLDDSVLIKSTDDIKTFNHIEIGSYWDVSGPGLYFDDIEINEEFDSDNDGMDDGYETFYGVPFGGWQNPYIFNARYGLIIGSGGDLPKDSDVNGNFPAHWNDAYELHNKLVNDYGYLPENVYLLYSKWIVFHPEKHSTIHYLLIDSVKIRKDGGEWKDFSPNYFELGSSFDIKIKGYVRNKLNPVTNIYSFNADGSLFSIIGLKYLYHYDSLGTCLKIFVYKSWYEDWSTNPSVIDGEATRAGLENSLKEIGERITKNDFMFMGILAHGYTGGFSLRKDLSEVENEIMNCEYQTGNELDYISYAQVSPLSSLGLKEYLSNHIGEKYSRMAIVVQACYSGSAIPSLSGENRIIITSSKDSQLSYTENGFSSEEKTRHFSFLHEGKWGWFLDDSWPAFTPNLGSIISPNSIEYAFEQGKYAAQKNAERKSESQNAQIDSEGLAFYTFL